MAVKQPGKGEPFLHGEGQPVLQGNTDLFPTLCLNLSGVCQNSVVLLTGDFAMQTSFSELEYATKKKQTRRDRFLAELEAITPWTALEQCIAPFYPSDGGPGRPSKGLTRMLRMYIAQQCFGFSDEGTEDGRRHLR